MSHVHKYERADIGVNKPYIVYRCALPTCSHYLHSKELVKGKKSICWRCGEEFIIDAKSVELRRPHCQNCTKTRKVRPVEDEKALDGLLEKFGLFSAEDDNGEETDDDSLREGD